MNEKSNKHYFLFLITTVLFWFSMYIYVPELSTYARDLGASLGMIGRIAGIYGFVQLILRIPLGWASDFFRKRRIFIQAGLFVLGISAMITYIKPSPTSLMLTRLTAGIAASTWVIFVIYFSTDFHKNETVKSIGVLNGFNAFGQLCAMLVGGFLSYRCGVRFLYLVASLTGFVAFIFTLFLPKEKVSEINDVKKSMNVLEVLLNKQLVITSILAILSQVITFGSAFGFIPILASDLGAGNYQLSFLTALAIIPSLVFSRWSTNQFANWLGKKNVLMIGFLISGFLCIFMPWIPSLGLLYVAQFVGGVGRSMTMPLLMGLSIEQIEIESRSTAMGIFQAVYGIGMVLGPVLLGSISEIYRISTGFFVIGILGLLAVVMVAIWKKE